MGIFTKRLNKDNRGFSLIELVIAVALLSVVGTAVFGFMTVGAKTFSTTSSEVNLQNESQLAFNQMQDIIIDTAVGIDYGYYTGSFATRVNVADDSQIPANCEGKYLLMYNTDKVYELMWEQNVSDPTLSKLYYIEYV